MRLDGRDLSNSAAHLRVARGAPHGADDVALPLRQPGQARSARVRVELLVAADAIRRRVISGDSAGAPVAAARTAATIRSGGMSLRSTSNVAGG